MGWLWLFTTDLSHPVVPQSQISHPQHVCIFSICPASQWMGLVVAVSFPAVLILPSDFTRSPTKVRMTAVTPGMLLERYNTMHTFNMW